MIQAAREGLLPFTTYTMPRYQVSWHHEILCSYLDRFVRGEIKRLIISLPPRHGKSELVSRRLPAYLLGRDPDLSIIACSYGADLASRMNRDCQRIIDSDRYRDVFPGTKLFGKNIRSVAGGTYLRNSDIFEIVNHEGVYRSAGVGGGITGMGADVAIIDDPIKDRKEAASVTVRKAVWEWYTSTLYSRLEDQGRVLVTMTRWHEDDLAGRLVELAKTDPKADQWVVVSLPAIAEGDLMAEDPRSVGQALWPAKKDEAALEAIRANNEQEWQALFQQRPSPPEGGLLKRHWWRYWQPEGANLPPVLVEMADGAILEIEPETIPARFDDTLQSWDATFKETKAGSYVVGQVWSRKGADKYLRHQVRARQDFTATLDAIRSVSRAYPEASAKLIEEKANGAAIISTLKREIAGLIPIQPNGSKEARASAVTPEIQSGNVYLPHPALYGWVPVYIEEAAAFPHAAHDDQVDATTQALSYMRQATIDPAMDLDFGNQRSTWNL